MKITFPVSIWYGLRQTKKYLHSFDCFKFVKKNVDPEQFFLYFIMIPEQENNTFDCKNTLIV